MKTKAVRLYRENDLRIEEFELPEIEDDEILVENISDSVCMSTYKAAILGKKHKRVPQDLDKNPIIVGHEFSGNIIKVGSKWKNDFREGSRFALQPALNYKGTMWSPGYSYMYFGGDATYNIIPQEVMELGCLMNYGGEAYYEASLAEPMSCIIGAFHACYHTTMGVYEHRMGIVEGGRMALLAAAGPMGLGAVDYALHCERKPGFIAVTDVSEERLQRARRIFTEEEARKSGVELIFINTRDVDNVPEYLKSLTGGKGYDDVFVFAPVKQVVEQGNDILGRDGCLNFFAGPTDTSFFGMVNFYDVHYTSTHVMGTTGGNTNDLKESLELTVKGRINPAVMITHIGGMDCVPETVLNLPRIHGGKKLIYTHINMKLTAIEDFKKKGEAEPIFAKLYEIIERNKGLWCPEAEKYLLENWNR